MKGLIHVVCDCSAVFTQLYLAWKLRLKFPGHGNMAASVVEKYQEIIQTYCWFTVPS